MGGVERVGERLGGGIGRESKCLVVSDLGLGFNKDPE